MLKKKKKMIENKTSLINNIENFKNTRKKKRVKAKWEINSILDCKTAKYY